MPQDQTIHAHVVIADFVNIDDGGKANIIGGGVTMLGVDAQQGVTSAFAIHVRLVSRTPLDDRPAVEIVLVDASGQPVLVPGPMGESQAVRISQIVEFLPAVVAGVHIPAGSVPSSNQFAINFSNGLPLTPGQSYSWHVRLDHEVIASESFFVPHAPTGPVVG